MATKLIRGGKTYRIHSTGTVFVRNAAGVQMPVISHQLLDSSNVMAWVGVDVLAQLDAGHKPTVLRQLASSPHDPFKVDATVSVTVNGALGFMPASWL